MHEDQDHLTPILEALQAGRFDEYVSLATAFTKANSKDALWSALAEAHGRSFDLFERLHAWPRDGTSAAMRRLLPAVERAPELSAADGERLLAFGERVPGSHRYSIAEVLRPHLARSPELGEQLGETLRHGSFIGEGSARIWAGAFGVGAPEDAAQFAVRLCGGSERDVALMAVLLQFLPITGLAVQTRIARADGELVRALTGTVPEPSNDAWHALASLAEVSPAAMNALQQAVEGGKAGAIVAMSLWLHRLSSPTVGATAVPVERLLGHLLRQAVQDANVRSAVDSAIAGMLYRESLRPVALQFVGDLRSVDGDLDELFPETVNGLCEQPSDFARLLTEWLAAEGVTFSAMRSLLTRCSQHRAQASLDSEVFGGATTQRKVVAARRLLALTHNGPVLCQFIACLAEQPSFQPDGLQLAAQMLNEAFVEYPHATEEFLRERTRAGVRQEPFAHVYRGVYANVLRWRLVLRRLPQLAELRPTDAQLQALRAMRQRVNREIMRGAAERSVFASIFTNVHLAQGRRFATHTTHSTPQVAEMQQASHSIELPSSELADPVGGMLRRAKALAASR
jgi:hypothetical protein